MSYGTDKRLSGVGFSFPFEFVAQWYDYQESFVLALDPGDWTEKQMCIRDRRYPDVSQRRAGEGAEVRFLGQVGEDEALPVERKLVLAAVGGELHAAARLAGLEQEVYLGVAVSYTHLAPLRGRAGAGRKR